LWIVAIIVIALVSNYYSETSSELEVKYGQPYLVITNVGTRTVRVLDVSVNEREERKLFRGLLAIEEFKSQELKVGDQILLHSPCHIVRATIKTDASSRTYSF